MSPGAAGERVVVAVLLLWPCCCGRKVQMQVLLLWLYTWHAMGCGGRAVASMSLLSHSRFFPGDISAISRCPGGH